MKQTVLVVDDNANQGETLMDLLEELGYRGLHVLSAEEAEKSLEEHDVDILLVDISLPGKSGMWLLEKVRQALPSVPVVMVTGNTSTDIAVQAIKMGALDYIEKGQETERLEVVLTNASRIRQLWLRTELNDEIDADDPFRSFVGKSLPVKRVFEIIRRVGPTDAGVLILGESGTGKELVANAIVACSGRNRGPYLKVNSAALPKDTLESELFGHVKGSFTGAIRDRKGRFELAHGGTLFLDEIGEMPLSTQVKLLRVLQEGEFERVGGSEVIKVDVRIIAATNQNLFDMVREGKFREDLYYRLNVIQIELPPLRDRKEDIPLLCTYFLSQFCSKNEMSLAPETLKALSEYLWPGNIRELRNVIERISIIAPGPVIQPRDLPAEITSGEMSEEVDIKDDDESFEGTLEDMEREAIIRVLKKTNGVKQEAARMLGIGVKTLYRKLEKYQEEGVNLDFLK